MESLTMKLSLWAYHLAISDKSVSPSPSTSFLVLHLLPSPCIVFLTPSQVFAGCKWSTSNSLLMKLPKSRIAAHLHSFIVDFGSFTRRELLVNRMLPTDTWGRGINHREGRGCKTRKEVEEDRETTNLSAMAKALFPTLSS